MTYKNDLITGALSKASKKTHCLGKEKWSTIKSSWKIINSLCTLIDAFYTALQWNEK